MAGNDFGQATEQIAPTVQADQFHLAKVLFAKENATHQGPVCTTTTVIRPCPHPLHLHSGQEIAKKFIRTKDFLHMCVISIPIQIICLPWVMTDIYLVPWYVQARVPLYILKISFCSVCQANVRGLGIFS